MNPPARAQPEVHPIIDFQMFRAHVAKPIRGCINDNKFENAVSHVHRAVKQNAVTKLPLVYR